MTLLSAALRRVSLASSLKADRERELRQIKRFIKTTMTNQKRQVMGVGDIVFTVGRKETKMFTDKNDALRDNGEKYYIRVKNDIGSKEQMIVVWIKLVADKTEFITDLVIGSTRPNHEHFFFGDRDGYQVIIHPQLRGMGAADPTLCLWCKKESNKPRHIGDIQITYTKESHVELVRKNYEKLPLCLSKVGCAYANIWVLWTSKDIVRLTDSAHIEKELQDYSAMLKASPDDPMLIKMVEAANRRLREAQIQEEDHAKDIPSDDLVYTKQFLAVSKRDMDKMKSIFKRSIDFDRDGKISIEDFVMFLGEPLSMASFVRQIFALSSNGNLNTGSKYLNTNTAPMMDVGSTLKATAVFCMLSSIDLLKFVFAWYDDAGYGCIDNEDFRHIIASFHPRHSDEHVARALKEFDLPVGGTMSFETFERLVKTLPHLMYPAFRVQERMQICFMGKRFWRRKLLLYEEANESIKRDEEQAKQAEKLERRHRDEYAAELRLSAIDDFVQKKKKKNRRRYER